MQDDSKETFNMKVVHQEIKNSRFHFEKSKFPNLETFLRVENFIFFHNFEPIFTMMQDDSKETFNMKVVVSMRSKTFLNINPPINSWISSY